MKKLILILLICFSSYAFAQTETCRITAAKGDVKVFCAEKEEWQDAQVGMAIKKNDCVKTAEASSCDIRLQEHIFKIKENTDITFKELAINKISMEMQRGEIVAKLEKLPSDANFEIKSPVAVCGVRGTSFLCIYSETSGIERVGVFQDSVRIVGLGEPEKYVTALRFQKVTVSQWGNAVLFARGTGILSEEILGEVSIKVIDKGISLKAEASGFTREEVKKECIRKLASAVLSRKLGDYLNIGDIIKDDPEKLKMLYDFIYREAMIISSEVIKGNIYKIKMELKLEGLNSILGQRITSPERIIEKISEGEYSKCFGTLARVTTKRAAQVDGYRRLAEKIYGTVIDSKTTVRDFAVEDDTVVTTVEGIVRGARIVDIEYFSDGSVTVAMESRGDKIVGELKRVTGDIFGTHYMSIPVPIEIDDFDVYLELEGL